MAKNDTLLQSQAATLKNLENQMRQLATELCSRPQVTLPSDTENPRGLGKEHCKQLHINIPLVDALEEMPNYVKFMKDILSKKKCLSEYEIVALMKECSAFLQNKLPPKLKDYGSFTIPYNIKESYCGKALWDLGASINLMPESIFKLLGIGEVIPTIVMLQLTDQSLAYPKGKTEDILVRVDKFIFHTDFIMLEFEADKEGPIILGRPFLATGRTLVDVKKGELIMRVQDD
ncbi:uncharacterized protein LOC128039962 [Gossypium raimondii]|uniref:uncharacterized protein LOC128039962 n=1 Tax=Gossypium raimondii TaxID=29730 RepID=UPI00227B9F01|nr:uncharacterized protein LOC128039962 [Gossypium raimondii]